MPVPHSQILFKNMKNIISAIICLYALKKKNIALDHSIISPLWLVWVRAPHGSQVRQVKFYLRVCQVVFPGVLPFSPHLLIGSSRYEWNNLERDVKLNQKKKKIIKIEASVAERLSYPLCKPGVPSSIPGFSSLSDETLNRGPVSIWP